MILTFKSRYTLILPSSPQRWMKTLSQQGALLTLETWLRAAESQLEESCSGISRTSSTDADLRRFLKHCKVDAHHTTNPLTGPEPAGVSCVHTLFDPISESLAPGLHCASLSGVSG